jgi:hypothetical protein
MPAVLPPAEHTALPPLFIYGCYYRLSVHDGIKPGDAIFSLLPAFKNEEGSRKMQEMGSRSSPDLKATETKIEFNEAYCPEMTSLFDRIQSFLKRSVTSLIPLTEEELLKEIYGRKFSFDALAHPTTGRITVYFPELADL